MNNIDNKDNVLNNMENDNTNLDKVLDKSLISENDSTNSNQKRVVLGNFITKHRRRAFAR